MVMHEQTFHDINFQRCIGIYPSLYTRNTAETELLRSTSIGLVVMVQSCLHMQLCLTVNYMEWSISLATMLVILSYKHT